MVFILYKFSRSKAKQRMTEQTEQTEQKKVHLSRMIYASARYKYFIMPHILEEWLNGGECCDPAAVKMYLTEEQNAHYHPSLPREMLFARLSLDNQLKFSMGYKLFHEWDAKTAYKDPEMVWSCSALTRHIKCPWESRYALMDNAELDEAEDAVFEMWCKMMPEADEEEAEDDTWYWKAYEAQQCCHIKTDTVLPPCDDYTQIGNIEGLEESTEVTPENMLIVGDVFSYCMSCQEQQQQYQALVSEGCERICGYVIRTVVPLPSMQSPFPTPTSIVVQEVRLVRHTPFNYWREGEMEVHLNTSATWTTIDIAKFGLYGLERIANIRYDHK